MCMFSCEKKIFLMKKKRYIGINVRAVKCMGVFKVWYGNKCSCRRYLVLTCFYSVIRIP